MYVDIDIHVYKYTYTIHIYGLKKKEVFYKELPHTVIEAEKSQDVSSASQRPGRASGTIPVRV